MSLLMSWGCHIEVWEWLGVSVPSISSSAAHWRGCWVRHYLTVRGCARDAEVNRMGWVWCQVDLLQPLLQLSQLSPLLSPGLKQVLPFFSECLKP